MPRERHAVTAISGRHHAIEHVDATRHGFEDVIRRSNTHQITRALSGKKWRGFLAAEFPPGFPDGLTVWPAAGQWRAADGRITREDSYVLNVVHPRDARSDEALRAIAAAYRSRFRQESVLRVRQSACMTLHSAP